MWLLKSNTLKLPGLLAQYLYSKKQLDLPGIGSFNLDPSINIEAQEISKQKIEFPDGISFRNNPALKESPDLIAYISSETGKMKALASADLDSHLQLALQFLNMGKPFSFDGIGTLVKAKEGGYEFTPGLIMPEKIKEVTVKEKQPLSSKDSVDAKYQTYLSDPVTKAKWKKPVVALLVVCGILITIWAGYSIANKNSNTSEEYFEDLTAAQTAVVVDSIPPKEEVVINKTPQDYKYVLEVAQSKRAFKRYNQLRTNLWNVQLETSDSVQYKLFMRLPVTPDTTRVLDSLMVMLGRKVYIEHGE